MRRLSRRKVFLGIFAATVCAAIAAFVWNAYRPVRYSSDGDTVLIKEISPMFDFRTIDSVDIQINHGLRGSTILAHGHLDFPSFERWVSDRNLDIRLKVDYFGDVAVRDLYKRKSVNSPPFPEGLEPDAVYISDNTRDGYAFILGVEPVSSRFLLFLWEND